MNNDPLPQVPTVDLVKAALEESQELIKAEVALARHEALRQIISFKRVAIAAGVAAVAALLGVSMLLVALVLAIAPHPVVALGAGGVLLAVAGVAGGLGYKALPKTLLPQTRAELKADAHVLKARLA